MNTYRVLRAKTEAMLEIKCMILTMLKCLMQHMQNATKIGPAILRMACEMLQLTSIQLGIEIQMQLV